MVTDVDPRFVSALLGEDELGVVVRAHIHIEAALNAVLEIGLPHPSLMPRLPYEQRLRLACALGLDERWFRPLKVLGDIRNQFSHKLDTKLTDNAVNDLHAAIDESDRGGFMLGVTAAFPTVTQEDQFLALPCRTRFILLAVCLEKMLAQALEEFKTSRSVS